MKKLFIFLFLCLIFLLSISCSTKNDNKTVITSETPEFLYEQAMIELNDKNYDLARSQFNEIEQNYPLSNEAVQSQIMNAFIEYIKMNYNESILQFNRVIIRYPSHKNIDYAYYMIGMCYYEQIDNEDLEGDNNLKAIENFNQVINRFPESKYARDSEQKIIYVRENVAAKHMNIALFYLNQKKYLASMRRYQKVIDNFSKSKFVPEALFRLVEIYYTLGMIEDAKKTASVIGYNYPESQWYRYSYKLVGNNDENKSEKKSFFSKISNLLNKNEK